MLLVCPTNALHPARVTGTNRSDFSQQANLYEHQSDFQTAYFFLYRYARLILEYLPKHPDSKDSQYRQAWSDARRTVQKALAKLEDLRPRINEKYDRNLQALRKRSQERRAQELKPGHDASDSSQREDVPSDIHPEEHRRRAVHAANLASRRSRKAAQLQDISQRADDGGDADQDSVTAMIAARTELMHPATRDGASSTTTPPTTSATYNYPTVPHKTQSPTPPPTANQRHFPPTIPSKTPLAPGTTTTPPPLPLKTRTPPQALPPFPTPSHTESNTPLRTLFLPTTLPSTFLSLALKSTAANLETCALLLGTLSQNALFLTHLLLPPQSATSDSCEMTDEAALQSGIARLEEAEARDLLVLGWIHTHPRQRCFLSSRDLHTHVWYQASLPESVAAVCAPSHAGGPDAVGTNVPRRDYNVFRLTDPPGLGYIRDCRREGTFHPHEREGIYTDALGWPGGHVLEQEGLEFGVVDLRRVGEGL